MSFSIDDSGQYLCVTYSGEVTDELIFECLEGMLASPGFGKKDQLVDYTTVDNYRVTIPGLKRLAEHINEHVVFTERHRNAFVVPEAVQYGMGRVFLAYISSNNQHKLFRDTPSAFAWLDNEDDSGAVSLQCGT